MQVLDTLLKYNLSHNIETNPFREGWCIVLRSLSDIAFGDTKELLVGCREQLRKKRYKVWLKSIILYEKYEIKKIIVLKCKKNVSLWEIWQRYPI